MNANVRRTAVGYPREIGDLRERIRAGWQPEFGFFLEPDPTGRDLGNECLSQWYRVPMTIDGVQFPTAEHYMMWRKAQLFDDPAMQQRILADENPAIAKQLGRKVRGFNAETWRLHRLDIVLRGRVAKFDQHRILREYLLRTATAYWRKQVRSTTFGASVSQRTILDPRIPYFGRASIFWDSHS